MGKEKDFTLAGKDNTDNKKMVQVGLNVRFTVNGRPCKPPPDQDRFINIMVLALRNYGFIPKGRKVSDYSDLKETELPKWAPEVPEMPLHDQRLAANLAMVYADYLATIGSVRAEGKHKLYEADTIGKCKGKVH